MSDASSDSSRKKKSFSSRFKKLSKTFKRSNSSDSSSSSSDSDDERNPLPPRTQATKPAAVPPKPSHFTLSPKKPQAIKNPVRRGEAHGELLSVVGPSSMPDKQSPGTAAAPATTPAATKPSAVPQQPSIQPKAPTGSSVASSAAPARRAEPPATATTTATVTTPATSASAAPAGNAAAGVAPEKLPPREVVGGPVYGTPDLVLTGVKGDPDEVMNTVRTRGLVVHLAVLHEETVPPTMTMVLAMSPKLMVKAAVERNLPPKPRDKYSTAEVSQLVKDAIEMIRRSGIEYLELNILHDKKALELVAKASHEETPRVVQSYFGPYIGIYFAWLSFYTRALLFPTVAGVFLLIDQWRTGSPDSPLLPIFCVLIMVWTALFLDLWKRHNSQITFKWGVDGIEDDDIMRDSAAKEGEFKANPFGKLCVTVPVILAAIYAVIRVMLYCAWLSDHAIEVYGADSYMQYYPLVLYSVAPLIASTLYSFLAKALNDFEEHSTPVRQKNMLVIKMFAFQFVNSYSGLLYVGFWLKDLNRLRTLLMTMMMVKQFIQQGLEIYQPIVTRWIKDRQNKKNPPKEPIFLVKHTGTITMEEITEEMRADPADVEAEFLEMVLQFGYISMFAVVFPLAPLFAIANNVWEYKVDLKKLVNTRRPEAHAESSIGAWQVCLEMMGVFACLTNLLLAVLVSENVSTYIPTLMTNHFGTLEGKVVVIVVAEHVLFLIKTITSGLLDKVPKVVREAQTAMAIQQKTERQEFRRVASGLPPSKTSVGGVAEEATAGDKLRELDSMHDVWKFGPMWFLPLALLPFIVAWWKVSALMVLPIALVFVSFLQHQKDRSDKALALGIVSDPKVLKLVTGFLPAWYRDSDVERVGWLNEILDKLWVEASGATDDLFMTTIQPILDSYRPPGLSALGFRKVSLGTIPPKIVGVRALKMVDDKVVIDMDVRWASNAKFVVEAGVKAVPLLVTLDKICFSGRLRVELAPLVPVFPCFGAVVITFMEKPFIDFKFSLGRLDVMSIGPGDMSVGNLVSETIKGIVTSLMVFPVKMAFPILYEQDLLALASPTPSGVVTLTIVGCDNLRAADFGGKSDPYVTVKLGLKQQVKTDVKKGTLNPRFNQTFDLIVYERSVEVMELSVFDRDSGPGDDDSLGNCDFPLSVLQADVEASHNIALSNTKKGSVLIKATFVPLSSGSQRSASPDEDVIVGMAGDVITDQNVTDDVYQNLHVEADGNMRLLNLAPSKALSKTSVDPGSLKPETLLNPSDTSMGVLSIMGIECTGVKPGDRYVAVVCGNTKRKTAVVKDMSEFACPEVFHFLIRGAKSAVVEVLLKEEEVIGDDKVKGSFKVNLAEVVANGDQLDGTWDLTGEKAKGAIKMRFKWAGRLGDGSTS